MKLFSKLNNKKIKTFYDRYEYLNSFKPINTITAYINLLDFLFVKEISNKLVGIPLNSNIKIYPLNKKKEKIYGIENSSYEIYFYNVQEIINILKQKNIKYISMKKIEDINPFRTSLYEITKELISYRNKKKTMKYKIVDKLYKFLKIKLKNKLKEIKTEFNIPYFNTEIVYEDIMTLIKKKEIFFVNFYIKLIEYVYLDLSLYYQENKDNYKTFILIDKKYLQLLKKLKILEILPYVVFIETCCFGNIENINIGHFE